MPKFQNLDFFVFLIAYLEDILGICIAFSSEPAYLFFLGFDLASQGRYTTVG